MKKFFLFAAMAGVALTGCVKTESEVAVKSDSNRIVFDSPVVSSVTRALITDAVYPTNESFSVFAQHENEGQSTLYMSDVKASYDGGTNSWIPEGNYYWPKQGTLSFAAYSPAEAKGDVFTSVTWDAASGFGISGFNAETNNDATKLYDLMYSDYAEDKTKGDQVADNPNYYGVQLKFKRILYQQIIIHRHLKGRSYHTTDRVNGTVTSPINLLHLNQPFFGIRHLDLVNALLPKGFFLNHIDHKVII